MTDRKKILVARIGAFGDVCMLAPLVQAVARRHEVHWLIRDAYEPVIRGFPEVGCRLVGCAPGPDPERPFPADFVESLRRERYDCLVDCSHWACVGWLARQLTDVPVRATTADPRQDALLAVDRGPEGLAPFNRIVPVLAGEHQLAKWRRLFHAACGLDVEPEWTLPDRPAIETGTPLRVFLHPHAGKPEKIWPVRRFARVLAAAARRRPIHCTVNGVRRRIVRSLRLRMLLSRVRFEVAPFDASFTTLRDALLQSDLALGCDSGPMHYAALLGVPTLVLYGRYSAAEFAPPWRSTAVEPPPGCDVDAVPVAAVSAALESVVGTLRLTAGGREIAA
jgi:ADP-heptose:LPS heptosyltransferase